jgi:hypothetical protein
MAAIRREIMIDARADDVWAAVRDFGAIHQRLAPGFVTDARLDGHDRIVTFFNGNVLREALIDLDDDAPRLVWSIVDGPYTPTTAQHRSSPTPTVARASSGSQTCSRTTSPTAPPN